MQKSFQYPYGVYVQRYSARSKSASRFPVATAFFVELTSHSQTINTFHPDALRDDATRVSRATFFSNFSTQNAVLLFGVVAILQLECRCQKHPWTKITALYRGNTRSGLPGKPDPFRR